MIPVVMFGLEVLKGLLIAVFLIGYTFFNSATYKKEALLFSVTAFSGLIVLSLTSFVIGWWFY